MIMMKMRILNKMTKKKMSLMKMLWKKIDNLWMLNL